MKFPTYYSINFLKCLAIGSLIFVGFFFLPLKSYGATGINKQINFQGKLVDANGLNVADGAYTVVFTLYDAATAGTTLWTETDSVTTTAGIFHVALGAGTALPGSVDFNTDNIYLGIKVGADAEMTPRIQFAAVPYAFNADRVNGITFSGTTGSTFTLPSSSDTLAGLAATQTLTNKTIGSTGLTFSGATTDITTGTNENLSIVPNGTGNVGIGTTSPQALLHVDGGTTGGNAVAIFNQTGASTNDILSASSSGVTKFTLGNNGDITQTSTDTTGTAYTLNANSLTTGNGIALNTNALTTGTALNIISTSTALSTGGLESLYWNPGSATTSTGDLLSLNVGANATIGNLLNIKNNGSSLFSVSQTQITNSLPTSFTSPGDVGIAYDINFTNPVASFIKSASTLTLQAGEAFNSSNLTLRSFNSGMVIADAQAFETTGAATVSGQLVIGTTTPTPSAIGNFYLTNSSTYGKALAILNQTESQDIFTASTSGATEFTIGNNGNLKSVAGALWEPLTDSTTALGIANSTGTSFVNFDTTNSRVGIGTSSPLTTLDVRGNSGTLSVASVSGTTSFASLVANNNGVGDLFTASQSGWTRFVIQGNGNVGINDSSTAINNALKVNGSLCVKNGTGACAGNTAGTIYATTTTISAADYAENYVSSSVLEPGDVIMPAVDGNSSAVVRTTSAYQGNILGVVSTDPGVTINSDAKADNAHPYVYPIGLSGRVPVKVSTINGSISQGDFLTASEIPGVAMKATKAGTVIGKALESFDCHPELVSGSICQGKITAAIAVSWYDPSATLRHDDYSNKLLALSDRVSFLEKLASSSAINNSYADGASVLGAATSSATLSGDLAVVGKTTLNNLGITGTIDAGILMIDGLAGTINTLASPLRIQSDSMSGVEFMGGKVSIDTSGNISAQKADFHDNVIFEKQAIFNSDAAGIAQINKGSDSAQVVFENPYSKAPFITATQNLEGQFSSTESARLAAQDLLENNYNYVITGRSEKGFTIVLNKPAVTNLDFSWTATEVAGVLQ